MLKKIAAGSLLVIFLLSILIYSTGTFTHIPSKQPIRIAVASNFLSTLQALQPMLEARTGREIVLHSGASGQLAIQISQGAPFDVFFSADTQRPQYLIEQGYADADSLVSYAFGRLVLWAPGSSIASQAFSQKLPQFQRIAIANPDIAPYGKAAHNFLQAAFSLDEVELIQGQNIAQAYQYVALQAVDAGLLAYSQVLQGGHAQTNDLWFVPEDQYSAIEQQAVAVKKSVHINQAIQIIQFLTSPEAKSIIQRSGYGV